MNPCLLIPVYNHGATVAGVVQGLAPLDLVCFVVDDGSDPPTRRALERLAADTPWVRLARRPRNGGRGPALRLGYQLAARAGFSHVVQLDADGQHDPRDVPSVLEAARRHPEALVLGDPRFDETAPRARRWGRWLSRFWVWVETWSFRIRDPLCGLRCFPLAPTLQLLDRVPCADHMDFDTEVAVRLHWAGVPVVNVPVRVRYFADGLSHFHMLWDNLRISWLHTRLVFGMLGRAPGLVARRRRDST